jgi:hypothetical protein
MSKSVDEAVGTSGVGMLVSWSELLAGPRLVRTQARMAGGRMLSVVGAISRMF